MENVLLGLSDCGVRHLTVEDCDIVNEHIGTEVERNYIDNGEVVRLRSGELFHICFLNIKSK